MEELLTSLNETRCIYHSDLRMDNFLLDSDRKVYIIDFQHIGVLPKVFQTFAFFNLDMKFAAAIGRKLGYQPTLTANAMVRVSNLLQMCGGNARLGGYLLMFMGI
jgi:predicted unusual protein kinase regulating ubiquinone biosynthesis (AarF/ABC1/UbiB family)